MIQLAGNLVALSRGIFNYGHLQLHYQGVKVEVQKGFVFNRLPLEGNTPYLHEGEDFYRSTPIIIGERTADNVWDSIGQIHASYTANAAQLAGYVGFGGAYSPWTNSNSYAFTLMWSVGASAGANLAQPHNVSSFPGYGRNLLLRDGTAVPINYIDTYGNDFIRGGLRDDYFSFSGGGNDQVFGYGGDDEFVFSSGTLTIGDSDLGDVLKWNTKTLTGVDPKAEGDGEGNGGGNQSILYFLR